MLFRFIKKTPKISFIENRKKFYILSLAFAIISIFSLLLKELNFGIDFKGGVLVEIKLENNIELESLRNNIAALNYGDFSLQKLDLSIVEKLRGSFLQWYQDRRFPTHIERDTARTNSNRSAQSTTPR